MTVNDSLLKMHKYSKEINQRIFRELKTFYPKLNYLFIFDKEYESDSVKKKLYYVFIDDWKAKIKYKKLKQWLTRRLDADSVYLGIESK
jgi:hypothetical protein